MSRLLDQLGIDLPLLAAPMAGGTSTPALVSAAARSGGLGFLAAGYQSAPGMAEQIAAVRSAGVAFGVNLFAPNPVPVCEKDFRDYARALAAESHRYGLALPGAERIEDDDGWAEKLDTLSSAPVPVVSFTFGFAEPATVAALRKAGTLVLQTVTAVDEARAAAETGVDGLIVQAVAAGGHSATLTPANPGPAVSLPELIAGIRQTVTLPVLGTGGVGTSRDTAAALAAGAEAVLVGTTLLRTDESGASAAHKAALADPAFTDTVVTRAFTGRPARALANRFTERYGRLAPLGYPAVHHLTAPLRKAAAAAGDTDTLHLWAGTGYRDAREEPAAQALTRLAAGL